ncbi:MAG: TIGR02391 family protein [Xanthomonadaceae bacterium]|jgi:uncharacterized protein (TIGR02391 family)|nr:TIGR02391 family protein [Xanthomonadaceae bacterium]
MAAIPTIPDPTLQALCDVLGATDTGLTGTEIARYLGECGIEDVQPQITKRNRLFQALRARQAADRCANNVIGFLAHVMAPVRYVGNRDFFEKERERLNVILAFSGLSLKEDGQVAHVERATNLSEAEIRAGVLRKALLERKVHPDVIAFCRSELLVDDYFHAVFEATKSVAEKLRRQTGLVSDGATLVDQAFGIGSSGHPRLAFNSLSNESEKSEHFGLMNLIKGVFGAFRNTTAHAPRVHWHVSEQDALDVLTTLSLIHRRLDGAVRTHIP